MDSKPLLVECAPANDQVPAYVTTITFDYSAHVLTHLARIAERETVGEKLGNIWTNMIMKLVNKMQVLILLSLL